MTLTSERGGGGWIDREEFYMCSVSAGESKLGNGSVVDRSGVRKE